jgi:hypothetical protein
MASYVVATHYTEYNPYDKQNGYHGEYFGLDEKSAKQRLEELKEEFPWKQMLEKGRITVSIIETKDFYKKACWG